MDEYERLKAEKERILKAQEDAKDKRIKELEDVVAKYRTSINWGAAYSWLQHGAPTEGEGIAMSKQIIGIHIEADKTLAN